MTLSRRVVAEGLGTAFLLAAVVGSGIMGERLAGGNTAIALHICRNPSGRCAGFYSGRAPRRFRGDYSLSPACALAFFQSERGGVFTDPMTTKFDGVRDEETRFNSLHR
jgi:hypothetical protein